MTAYEQYRNRKPKRGAGPALFAFRNPPVAELLEIEPFNVSPAPTPDDLADTVGNNAYFNNLNIKGILTGGGGMSLPLGQNLTFSPDSTYNIGGGPPTYDLRPNNIYVETGVTFRSPSNESILRYDPTQGHTLALMPTASAASREQTLNIYAYYSGPDWLRLAVGPYGLITQRQGSLLPHFDLVIGSEDIESIIFQTNFSTRWKIDGTTGYLSPGNNNLDIGLAAGNKVRNIYAGQFIPTSKVSITGSRAGNAALASLLTALASYGLVTDTSTA